MKQKILIILFSVSCVACAQPSTLHPQVSAEEAQMEQAHQLQLVQEAASKGGTPRPWRARKNMKKEFLGVADRIEKSGAAICQELGLPEQGRRCYYYFDTSASDEINAFANGRDVIVTYGMLRFLRDEDEVAFVTAHELAHNLMGHLDAARNNMIAGGIVGMLLDVAAASQGFNTGGGLGNMGAEAGQLAHSIPFEQEADYIALYIAARAGYDISVAPGIWRRMSLEDPEGIYHEHTHPSNATRYVGMGKAIAEIEQHKRRAEPLVPKLR